MDKQSKVKLHVGMRTWKTVLAVFICAMIDWARGRTPFYSMLAAVVSIQPDMERTLKKGIERMLSSLLGGAMGLIFLLLIGLTPIESFTPPYYLFISLMLIPIITLTVSLKRPECAYLSCVVFLSIAVMHTESAGAPLNYAINRTIDTLVGLAVGIIINLIPAHTKPTPALTPEADNINDEPTGAEPADEDTAELVDIK